jgi:acetyltransferase-like isoleucine patch superfamily enzyme
VPDEFTTIKKGPVVIGQVVLIGAHSVILPGVTIGDAGSVGAMAVVTKSIAPGEMARATAAVAVVGGRKRDAGKIMAMAKDFLARAKKK